MKEYIEKAKIAYREFCKKCRIMKVKVKLWWRNKVTDFERKRGLGQRCEWCDERIFCETYCGTPAKRRLLEPPKRCTDYHSGR